MANETSTALFPVAYHLAESLQELVRGRRVAIVNDVISAGSAVRGTHLDLERLHAEVVVVAALMVMGDGFAEFAREKSLPVERLAEMSLEMWRPEECPLCRKGVEFERLARA